MNLYENVRIFDNKTEDTQVVENSLVEVLLLLSDFHRNAHHQSGLIVFEIVDHLFLKVQMRHVAHHEILPIVEFGLAELDVLLNFLHLGIHKVVVVALISLLLYFLAVVEIDTMKGTEKDQFPFDCLVYCFNSL